MRRMFTPILFKIFRVAVHIAVLGTAVNSLNALFIQLRCSFASSSPRHSLMFIYEIISSQQCL